MDVQVPSSAVHGDGSVSVQEAAAVLGLSEKTIRRRIKAGTLPAHRLPTSQGYEWRVQLTGYDAQVPTPLTNHVDGHADHLPSQNGQAGGQHTESGREEAAPATASSEPADQVDARLDSGRDQAMLKALDLADRLQRENMELAGRLGFLQAKLQHTEERLLALAAGPAPSQPDPTAPPHPPAAHRPAGPHPWWKFWER